MEEKYNLILNKSVHFFVWFFTSTVCHYLVYHSYYKVRNHDDDIYYLWLLPQLLISFIGGVWADRHNKKYIIAISDSCIAISTLIVALFFVMGIESIWLLFIALAIRSFGAGVQTPTVNVIVPDLAPQDKLMRVNGINTTIQSVMLILHLQRQGH